MRVVQRLPVFRNDDGEEWVSAVIREMPCGCTVKGAGNLISPLAIAPCQAHADSMHRRPAESEDVPPVRTANAEEAFAGKKGE